MFTNNRVLRGVPQADRVAYQKVWNISCLISQYEVEHPKQSPGYRCHSVARALAHHVPSLKVIDGHYLGVIQIKDAKGKIQLLQERFYPHTWLVGPGGTIIDPYSVGVISLPMLVPTSGELSPFGAGMYYVNGMIPKCKLAKFTSPHILKETNILIAHIEKLLVKK